MESLFLVILSVNVFIPLIVKQNLPGCNMQMLAALP